MTLSSKHLAVRVLSLVENTVERPDVPPENFIRPPRRR